MTKSQSRLTSVVVSQDFPMRFLIFVFALCLTSPAWSQSAAPNAGEQPSGPISVEDSAPRDAPIAVRFRGYTFGTGRL